MLGLENRPSRALLFSTERIQCKFYGDLGLNKIIPFLPQHITDKISRVSLN